MRMFAGCALAAALLALLGWALSPRALPPADFTFCNGTEIKSVDPGISSGQPEGRIISSLFEGLVRWHPRTLAPLPGMAENVHYDTRAKKWTCISDDGCLYTLRIRQGAVWSDGTPFTAEDFRYTFQRFLDPQLGNEYVTLLTLYVVNADRYHNPSLLAAGDRVEVELLPPPGAPQGVRGPLRFGKLLHVEKPAPKADDKQPSSSAERPAPIYTVQLEGQPEGRTERFQRDAAPGSGIQNCRQVLLDFREVGIRVPDTHTLQIQLKHPAPHFLNLLGFYPLSPVNRSCLERHGMPAWTRPENIVCNGPYLLQERRLRDRIRLVKNPRYWDAANVALETVDALAVESDVTMLNMYMAGQADWIPNVPATMVPELLRRRERQLAAGEQPDFNPAPELTVNLYRFNVTKPPLDNKLVRQALALAIDRREIVRTVTQAGEIPALSLVPPGIPGYPPVEVLSFNPGRARELLSSAGFPEGKGRDGRPLRIEISFNTNDTHLAVAELVQRQWRLNLGVDAVLRNQEWASHRAREQQLAYQVSRGGWIGDYVDPNTFLDLFLGDNPNNQTGWKHKQYDDLVHAAAREADPQRRMELFRQAETILLDELPVAPLYFRVSKNLVRPYVRGFHNNLQDVHPLKFLSVDRAARERFWKHNQAPR